MPNVSVNSTASIANSLNSSSAKSTTTTSSTSSPHMPRMGSVTRAFVKDDSGPGSSGIGSSTLASTPLTTISTSSHVAASEASSLSSAAAPTVPFPRIQPPPPSQAQFQARFRSRPVAQTRRQPPPPPPLVPPPPPVPPHPPLPLRASIAPPTTSVSSFKTLIEHYTNRDIAYNIYAPAPNLPDIPDLRDLRDWSDDGWKGRGYVDLQDGDVSLRGAKVRRDAKETMDVRVQSTRSFAGSLETHADVDVVDVDELHHEMDMRSPSPRSTDVPHYRNWSVRYDVHRRGIFIPQYGEEEEEEVEAVGNEEGEGGRGGRDDEDGVGGEKPLPLPPFLSNVYSPPMEDLLEDFIDVGRWSVEDGQFGEKPLPLPPSPSSLDSLVKEEPSEDSIGEWEAEVDVTAPPMPVLTKREHALHELLRSERAYASDLALIRDVHIPLAIGRQAASNFVSPIKPPATSGSSPSSASDSSTSSLLHPPAAVPMTLEDMKIIFNNVVELGTFSDWLAYRLEEALGDVLQDGQGEDRVGKLFLEASPKMEVLYRTYVIRHPVALAHLRSLPRTPALAAYLSQTQTLASSLTHAWDLPSLLIKPVQRLLTYTLLLSTIVEETLDGHGDKDNLLMAKDKMEEVTRAVNEGRRRLEIVNDVLTGKLENSPLKKMLGKRSKKNTGISLGRTKGMRMTNPTEEQDEHVLLLENNIKKCDSFIREFAKDAVQWSKSVHASIEHLRAWATVFLSVLGLGKEESSEAFDAYLDVVDNQLLPLCEALKQFIQHELLPNLTMLSGTMEAPMKLLTAMHSLEPLHHSLDVNFSKARPPVTTLQASQRFIALRSQLDSELPKYLQLLDKGIVTHVRHFATRQTQFWADVRVRWGDLWDALRIEGETIAGNEETLRVWNDRFWVVDEAVSKLKIISRQEGAFLQQVQQRKVSGRSGHSRSTDAMEVSGLRMALPIENMQPMPNIQNGSLAPQPNQRHRRHERAASSRHHRVGSVANLSLETMESVGWSSTATSDRQESKSRPHSPDHIKKKGLTPRSAIATFEISAPKPLSPHRPRGHSSSGESVESHGRNRSSSFRQRLKGSLRTSRRHSLSTRSITSTTSTGNHPYGPFTPREQSTSGESVEWHGRSRSSSFRRRLSESSHGPLRHSPSNQSITSARGAASYPHITSTPPSNPLQNTTFTADSPALYAVEVVHPCSPPDGASYLTLPFFSLQNGDVFEVLSEAGHPSKHDGLPLHLDAGDDCLLTVRDEYGNLGWLLASFVVPIT